jgi:hypothetical protein
LFEARFYQPHAATNDPMVLAWSHIYLGWIYDYEGLKEQAKAEFQAALAVEGGPDGAKQAAQKSLTGGTWLYMLY